VTEDEDERFLDFVKISGGEELVEREILHE
jgi:hypothetical protein